MISLIVIVIITVFIPPLGVFFVAGCGADLLINILLTILGYFPGHIHGFYIEYIYYKRRGQAKQGILDQTPAPGVYSARVQQGGNPRVQAQAAPAAGTQVPVTQQQQGQVPFHQQGQAQYGSGEGGALPPAQYGTTPQVA